MNAGRLLLRVKRSPLLRPLRAAKKRAEAAAEARRVVRRPPVRPDGALAGRRVAVLVARGFEEVELTDPRAALADAGALTDLVAPAGPTVRSMVHDVLGDEFEVDVPLAAARPDAYDGLLLPGGVMNTDRLRRNADAVAFVRSFVVAGKPIAAICHGQVVLVDADAVRGRTLTSYDAIRRDLENAGARWVDEAVVVDGGLVTSRTPDDLPAFNRSMVEALASRRRALA